MEKQMLLPGQKLLQHVKQRYHWSNRIDVWAHSHLTCNGTMRWARLALHGRNNLVVIEEKTLLHRMDLVVRGNDNCITFGVACTVNGHLRNNNIWEEKE